MTITDFKSRVVHPVLAEVDGVPQYPVGLIEGAVDGRLIRARVTARLAEDRPAAEHYLSDLASDLLAG